MTDIIKNASNSNDVIYVNESISGGSGNDIYYIDNSDDTITEMQNAGLDTAYTSVSYSLQNNVENLTLINALDPVKAYLDNGTPVNIYGHPTRWELDYQQGNSNFEAQSLQDSYKLFGDCGLVSVANTLSIVDISTDY